MQMLILALLFSSFSAMSHQTSRTSSQKEIRWPYVTVPIRVANSSSSLVGAEALINQSLQQWSEVSGFKFVTSTTGNNQIQFLNNFSKYGSTVIGLTEVSYSPNGNINSAIVYLNEENFRFVGTPAMATRTDIYLKDVVTHELGHFTGLAHSEVLDSTMFFQNFPGQSEIAADDRAAIRSKYQTGFGKITGTAKGGNHIGILGVHVQAISRKTGEAIGAISNETGYFEITGLDLNDTYYLYSSPLKNVSKLSSYLANVQNNFCPGPYVGSFFSKCGRENNGTPQAITLTDSQSSVDVGVLSINCTIRLQDQYLQEKIKSSFSEIEVFDFDANPKHEKTYVGNFNLSELSELPYTGNPDRFIYKLSGVPNPVGKKVKFRLISQAFGNPVQYQVNVKKAGSVIGGNPFLRTTKPEGTLNLDMVASANLTSDPYSNYFELEIWASKLTDGQITLSIPDFANFSSTQTNPYLIVMSLEEGTSQILDTGSVLSDNSTCLDASFSRPIQNTSANADETNAKAQSAAAGFAGCGTIEPPSGPGPGSFFGLVSLGFLLSFLISSFSKRQKNFLS